MALTNPGPLSSAVSGNIGGLCFSTSKTGAHVRSALKRCNQQTPAQLSHRAKLSHAYAAWVALTATQRLAWSRAAEQYPVTNRLHLTRSLSPWSLFTALFIAAGSDFLGSFEDPPVMMAAPQPYNLLLTPDLTDGFDLSWDPSTSSASYQATAFAARSFSTVRLAQPKVWTYIGSLTPATDPWDIQSLVAAALGAPQAGELLWVKLRLWQLDRLPSELSVVAATVTP
jgi:hypothetical protein